MEKNTIKKLKSAFEECIRDKNGIEFWFARDLQTLLDYEEWRNFTNVIEKAEIACKTSGHDVLNHFVDVTKKVRLGSEAEREIDDVMLSRYACTPQN
jgi:DNA-damage-inducible protein D